MTYESCPSSAPTDLYEEDLNEDTTLDLSCQGLEYVPEICNRYLRALYLQENKLSSLPDDFFPSLPSLKWLDLRDNQLTELPNTIQDHPSLTHLLLQNNLITALPNELGTVPNLKVLQIGGNRLTYPPKEVLTGGVCKITKFLNEKYVDAMFRSQSEMSEKASTGADNNPERHSYNSVLDKTKQKNDKTSLSIQLSEKELNESDEDEYYAKQRGKCPKLASSRHNVGPIGPHYYQTLEVPHYFQSAKYLHPKDWMNAKSKAEQINRMKMSYYKDVALKKRKEMLQKCDKMIQDRKTMEQLRNWRRSYRQSQFHLTPGETRPIKFPYDTTPEYMTLLSREDIEKDLPDKYKKRIWRKARHTVPRKSSTNAHLAMKIKQLFDKLEAIDIDRGTMTPRTEQKVLLGEIQKISEIKQKLTELSISNTTSVNVDRK